jgi:hypothetical protein
MSGSFEEYTRGSLRRKGFKPETDAGLATIVQRSDSPADLEQALSLLGRKSVLRELAPRLEELCLSRSNEVQNSALASLVHALPRAQGALVCRALAHERRFRPKWALYDYLLRVAYKQDVPLVASYVRQTIRRGTRPSLCGAGTSISNYCQFLDEYIEHPAVIELYEWIGGRFDRLDEVDRESLRRRQPYFGHSQGRRWVLFVRDDRIGGIRLPTAAYHWATDIGMTILPTWNPRFASAFRRFATEADLIVALGAASEARVKKLLAPGMADWTCIPAPDYQRADPDQLRGNALRDWRHDATQEDRASVSELQRILKGVSYRGR